jgi:hypothetical protein
MPTCATPSGPPVVLTLPPLSPTTALSPVGTSSSASSTFCRTSTTAPANCSRTSVASRFATRAEAP